MIAIVVKAQEVYVLEMLPHTKTLQELTNPR